MSNRPCKENGADSYPSGELAAFGPWRYFKLFGSFARYCLIRELGFRVNFLARCATGVAWLFMLVTFFKLIYLRTNHIGDWNQYEYLFFMGTGFILNSLVNALFMENCTNLAQLIRTGDLDFALTKPIDEQFLLSCQRVDWATVPNILVGIGMLIYASTHTGVALNVPRIVSYALLLLAGLTILYSLMLIMASSSVWIVRNRGLYEVWFYVTQFSRYPAEIYGGSFAGNCLRVTLMFVLPVLLAVNIPARYGAKLVSGQLVLYLFVSAGLCLAASRWFFHFALRSYRSASS